MYGKKPALAEAEWTLTEGRAGAYERKLRVYRAKSDVYEERLLASDGRRSTRRTCY